MMRCPFDNYYSFNYGMKSKGALKNFFQFQFHLQITMASARECPFGSHSYLEVELESVSITMITTVGIVLEFLKNNFILITNHKGLLWSLL